MSTVPDPLRGGKRKRFNPALFSGNDRAVMAAAGALSGATLQRALLLFRTPHFTSVAGLSLLKYFLLYLDSFGECALFIGGLNPAYTSKRHFG